jgi:lipopolysaccharide/colanic/teichoic acid biosynthesis glycosyltransferase
MYAKFFKRAIDFSLSLVALLVLSPILLILTAVGAVMMGGNPFFTQLRPGRIDNKTGEEKIFRLIKFRTMSNKKDEYGNLLSDEVRLNKYGCFLRSTSLDELPELINILIGDMAIVGPRPLLVKYIPRYTKEQRRRHEIRPGLTGLAQINGRNAISWEERFELDVHYVDSLSFSSDVKIIFSTVKAVFNRSGISSHTSATMEEFMGSEAEIVTHE